MTDGSCPLSTPGDREGPATIELYIEHICFNAFFFFSLIIYFNTRTNCVTLAGLELTMYIILTSKS